MNNRAVCQTFSRHSGTVREKYGKVNSDCGPRSVKRRNAVMQIQIC